jgi:hypothetical protein
MSRNLNRFAPAIPTKVLDAYWRFAVERQAIFFRRREGLVCDTWTDDPILKRYKFTNAYRASDRVSQYLIRSVIYSGDQAIEEVFFRTLLFKFFNRIGTWELLRAHLGEITFADYSFNVYDRILTAAKADGQSIYSGAYIMPSGNSSFGHPVKHRNNLRLLEKMMADELPHRLKGCRSMKDAFELIRSYPSLGDFLAYQYVIDLNYSNILNFSEMEFVIPGPGCLSGMQKCFRSFGGLNEPTLIRLVTDFQEEEFRRLGLKFNSLWGRRLQLIDCQNLFCEIDKYSRVAFPDAAGGSSRKRIKQQFRANPEPIDYWFPPKWKLNEKLKKD